MRAYEIAFFTIISMLLLSYYQTSLNSATIYNTGMNMTTTAYGDVPTDVAGNIPTPEETSPILAGLESMYGMFKFMLSFLWILFKSIFLVPYVLKAVGLPTSFVAIISAGVYMVYGVAAYQIWTSRNIAMSE